MKKRGLALSNVCLLVLKGLGPHFLVHAAIKSHIGDTGELLNEYGCVKYA
jgi:hypothetical protein